MARYRPGAISAGSTRYASSKNSAVSPKAWPAFSTRVLASAIAAFFVNFLLIQSSVGSSGRV